MPHAGSCLAHHPAVHGHETTSCIVPPTFLGIPSGLQSLVAAERIAGFERAERRVAWQSEAAHLAISKLRRFFMDQLSAERFVLLPLGAGGQGAAGVASFRAACLPAAMQVSREAACWARS